MEQPWRIGEDGDVYEVPPVLPGFVPGDWAAVEEWLEVPLPNDYKELIGEGRGLQFGEELLIASPFSQADHLGSRIAYGSWSLAYLRQRYPDEFYLPLFPEPGGLLCWGGDGGGGVYYWNTVRPNPDDWTIVVSGRSVSDSGQGEFHECGLANYLEGLATGRIEPAALADWPVPDPQLRPLEG
jgi:hypothetical protein